MQKYTIDAKGRAPGRVATEVAVLLMGKNRVDFAKNTIPDVEVEVIGAKELKITEKKAREKIYTRHSLYPGGIKRHSAQHVIDTKGAKEVLKKAIYGMLPKNKLRPRMMTRLKIKD